MSMQSDILNDKSSKTNQLQQRTPFNLVSLIKINTVSPNTMTEIKAIASVTKLEVSISTHFITFSAVCTLHIAFIIIIHSME